MEAIPDEVLFTEIFGRLTGHIATLWVVCKRWHAEARKLQVRPVQHPLRIIAAEEHLEVLAWFREYYYANNFTVAEIDLVLECSARRGHELVCRQVRAWYPSYRLVAMMIGAAAGGHVSLCRLVRDWHDSGMWGGGLFQALRCAAEGGFEDVCRLVKEWIDLYVRSGSREYNIALDGYNKMLEGAALGGHPPLCHLARQWGARDFRAMLAAAKLRTSDPVDEIRCLAQEWLSTVGGYGGGGGGAGGIFQLIANDGKADRMIMNTEILNRRLAAMAIVPFRQQNGAPTSGESQESKTPTD